MTKQKPTAFITLALDPVCQSVTVIGFGKTREDCLAHAERSDAAYQRTFQICEGFALDMFGWLNQSGVPSSEAPQIVRRIGQAILEILK